MEEQLIGEIERRPVLFDRSVQACKKMSARDEAWREVADIIKQSESEVKKRWRTLRDSFMRFHRLQRTYGPKGRKKMWIYYNEMAFLIPHIEPRDYKMTGNEFNEYNDDTMDGGGRLQEPQAADMVSIASDMCEAELTTPPPPQLPPPPPQPPQPPQPPPSPQPIMGTGCPCYNGEGGVHVHQEPAASMMMMMDHPGGKRTRRADESPDAVAESDEHFALSCVAALRRLSARKNAETRLRILHVLYEAEYGEDPAPR